VTQGFWVPKLPVLATTYNLYLAYRYIATLKICILYVIHAYMAHTVFDLSNTFPTSDWQEGFHWVVTKVLTLMNCFLSHNRGKRIYEKSLFRLMLGQYPQTGYEYLHFFVFHLSAISCHLMQYNKPRNKFT